MLRHRLPLLLACAMLFPPAARALLADEVEDRIVQWYNRFWEYFRAGKYPQAEKIARDTLALCETYAADRPAFPTYGLECVAKIHMFYGRLDKAENAASRCVQLAQEHLGEDKVGYGDALVVLGDVQFQQGLYAQAQATHEKAFTVLKAAAGEESEAVAEVLWALA